MTYSGPEVIAAGHICLDLFPRFTNEPGRKLGDLLRPGTLVKMGDMTFSTGGSVFNTGMALRIFGCRVGFAAKVGDDAIGRIITDVLRRNGNADGVKVSAGEPSSYTVVLAPQGVDRVFLHCPGTNDTFVSGDIDFNLVRGARLFHFGYPTLMDALHAEDGRELEAIFSGAKRAGAATSMDISLPDPCSPAGRADWRAIYGRVLPKVDVFTPSIEEAFFTLDPAAYLERKASAAGEELIEHITPGEFRRIAGEFVKMGCAVVALKAGHNGWYLRAGDSKRLAAAGSIFSGREKEWAGRELWCPAFAVDRIVSATGAGDVSIAAFLAALLRGAGPERCLKMANCAGYMNLRAMDATGGLVSWDEMERVLPSLLERGVSALDGAGGWEWEKEERLWERIGAAGARGRDENTGGKTLWQERSQA